jgi:hypothetical protein
MGPIHKIYGHTGGLTHLSELHSVVVCVCLVIVTPTNVEQFCDTVLNIVLDVVPEDDACIETHWIVMF